MKSPKPREGFYGKRFQSFEEMDAEFWRTNKRLSILDQYTAQQLGELWQSVVALEQALVSTMIEDECSQTVN